MILDDIMHYRSEQLEREKAEVDEATMKRQAEADCRTPLSLYDALKKDRLSIIAEVKKASPSKGLISEDFHPVQQARAYEDSGADAISCLTEEHYFQGRSEYLTAIKEDVKAIPILRKDFIYDPYQIYQAKVIGADAILLIAAVLTTDQLRDYKALAHDLGLQVLAEAHNKEELDKIQSVGFRIVGINNRDLKTFTLSLETTANLASEVGHDQVLVSESGMKTAEDTTYVRKCGADAVLVGETLMRSDNISQTMAELRGVEVDESKTMSN